MLIDELTALKKTAELVTLSLDYDSSDLTGIIHIANNQITALVQYSDEGEYQGWTFFETSQITRICWGNREHKAIASLIDNSFERVLPLKSKSQLCHLCGRAGAQVGVCRALYGRGRRGFRSGPHCGF